MSPFNDKPGSQQSERRRLLGLSGFTIVELLVVIAIIALLIGILIPALWRAKQTATSAMCHSTLAGLGRAFHLYANDSRGFAPTFDYNRDGAGVVEPIVLSEWGTGGGGWLVLPVNEIAFWAYPLRGMVEEGYADNPLATVEQMSCPTVHARWVRSSTTTERLKDPLSVTQDSFFKSTALFTSATAWTRRTDVPDLNKVQAAIRFDQVRFPSTKSILAERWTNHNETFAELTDEAADMVNVLAADGHVQQVIMDEAREAHGFVAEGTGTESPPLDPNAWEHGGIPLISTHQGINGQDW